MLRQFLAPRNRPLVFMMQIILCLGVSMYVRLYSKFLRGSKHSKTLYSALIGEAPRAPSIPLHPSFAFPVPVRGGWPLAVLLARSYCHSKLTSAQPRTSDPTEHFPMHGTTGNWIALALHMVDLFLYQQWKRGRKEGSSASSSTKENGKAD